MKGSAKLLFAFSAIYILGVLSVTAAEMNLKVMVYRGGQNLPLFVAQEEGFFKKHGLNVDLINAQNSDELGPGLTGGNWQIIHSTSDNAVKIHDVDGVDVALVIGGDNAHNHIISQKSIKSFSDLRGKTIVLDGADTGYAYVLYSILKQSGLNKGDYNLKLVGATPKRLEALLNDNTNSAALINPPFSVQAIRAGLNDLGSVVSMIGPYQGPAGYTLRSWAKDHRETLIDYLEAYIEAVRWTLDKNNQSKAKEILGRRLSLAPDLASDVFDIITGDAEGFAKDGKFDMAGFRNVLALRASYEGKNPSAPEKYLDLSYYDRALENLDKPDQK